MPRLLAYESFDVGRIACLAPIVGLHMLIPNAVLADISAYNITAGVNSRMRVDMQQADLQVTGAAGVDVPGLEPHPATTGRQAQQLQPVAPSSACSAAAPPPRSCRSRQRFGAAPWACLWPCSARHPPAWAAPAPSGRRASPATHATGCVGTKGLQSMAQPYERSC